jgi:uncharacterized protein (TIGR02145 family)
MKKRTYILIIHLFLIVVSSQAQIGIGTTTPDASAIMDITSINKGIVLPRMDTLVRKAMSLPAKGLLIYNTSSWCIETNSGDGITPNWTSVSAPKGPNGFVGPIGDTGVTGANGISTYLPTGYSNFLIGGSSVVLGGWYNSSVGIASGIGGGYNNTTIGGASFIAGGINNTTVAVSNTVFGGSTNTTNGTNSFIGGGFTNRAEGNNSAIIGGTLNAITSTTVDSTISGGSSNTITGATEQAVISGGTSNIINNLNGTVSGGSSNKALAISATVSGGIGNEAKSYGEWVGGLYASNTEPNSASVIIPTDKLFHIGNGTGPAANLRSDAFLVLKNGTTTLPSVTKELIEAGSEKAIITKEFAYANYYNFKTTAPTTATDIGQAGEIRITPSYIYTCYEDNKWVRTPSNTYTSSSTNGSALIITYNCTTSNGSLYEGYVTSGVTQSVDINVTVAGTYVLTATANGITFSASGTATTLGLQTIIFKATGIPIAAGSNSFTINTTQNCSFNITTLAKSLAPLLGTIASNSACSAKTISTRPCEAYSITVGSTTYGTMSIGGQCWMTDNLKVIPSNFSGFTPTSWITTTTGDLGYWGYYNQADTTGVIGWGTSENAPKEGYLYQWSAAMNGSTTERAQGVCPTAWHIPSDCEWMYLENALGMSTADQQLTGSRNSGAVGSQLSVLTQGGTNSSGFSALLSGYRDYAIEFIGRGTETEFWSSSIVTPGLPVIRKIESLQTGMFRSLTAAPANGYSVRCLKD